jgi:D-alanyl-D-alanine carboxypeptidase/D-alanyl-D-alanine-endopeptidase (penicillin-binding protein 4)
MVTPMTKRHRLRAPIQAAETLVLLVLASACATRSAATRVDPPTLDFVRIADSVVATPPLHRAHIGIEVYDPATRRILYQHNAERHFIPASNQKLWPTSTALHELGPDFRYRTPVLGVGADPGTGTVHSIVVVGRGDPTFSERFYPVDSTAIDPQADTSATTPRDPLLSHRRDLAVLDSLADSIVARGVKRITGDLIVDASYFDEAIVPGSWTVGNVNGTSAPPTGAFVVAEGIMRVRIAPGATFGAPAIIEPLGPAAVVPILNRVVTTEPGEGRRTANSRGPWSDTLRITGTIGLGANGQALRLPMTDPVVFAAHALGDALRARGVAIDGRVRVVRDSIEAAGLREGRLAGAPAALAVAELTSWTSPPLSDIVRAILAPSQNWIAEQLLRTLGAEKRGEGSWRAGLAVETSFLFGMVGIDSTALRLNDGSGMSYQNLVTPHAVVQLFDYARTAPWSDVFRAALAKPREPGTLSGRLRELEGRLAGKTGTLSSVNALSGYVRTRDGRELIFSILSNASGLGGGQVVGAIDLMVDALANGTVPR